jgi:DNA-binding transcriptional MerR regulator
MDYPVDDLFSRKQVQQITGISDDVLGYWMRERLLVPKRGHKGTHRRFEFVQLHIAAVLGAMHGLGANIGVLRAFASKMQRGVEIQSLIRLDHWQLYYAIDLARNLTIFESGTTVPIRNPARTAEPSRRDLPNRIFATSPDEIVAATAAAARLDCDFSGVAEAAKELNLYDASCLESYRELVFPSYIAPDKNDFEWVWVAWIDRRGSAQFRGGEAGNTGLHTAPTAAFWLTISRLIRRLWLPGQDNSEAAEWVN